MKGENCCDKKMDLWNIVVLCITLFISCSSIPLPTPVQLRYQQAEIIATIGFQMDYGVNMVNYPRRGLMVDGPLQYHHDYCG